MRKLLSVVGLVVGMVAVGAGPSAATYAGDAPDGVVLNSTLSAGEAATFVADCFVPGTTVGVTVTGPGSADVIVAGGTSGTNEASGDADEDGAILAFAEATRPGVYTITAAGDRTPCGTGTASANFTVVPDDDAASGGSNAGSGGSNAGSGGLPRTGPDGVAAQVGLGAALVLLGAGFVALTVSRRRAGPAAA